MRPSPLDVEEILLIIDEILFSGAAAPLNAEQNMLNDEAGEFDGRRPKLGAQIVELDQSIPKLDR